jgi:hypothetical protein
MIDFREIMRREGIEPKPEPFRVPVVGFRRPPHGALRAVTCTLEVRFGPCDAWWLHVHDGAVTGYESARVCELVAWFDKHPDYTERGEGWYANAGSEVYDRLVIPRAEVARAIASFVAAGMLPPEALFPSNST